MSTFKIDNPINVLSSDLNSLSNSIINVYVILDPSFTGNSEYKFNTWDKAYTKVKDVVNSTILFQSPTEPHLFRDSFFLGASGTYDMTNITIGQNGSDKTLVRVPAGITLSNLPGVKANFLVFELDNITQHFIVIPEFVDGRLEYNFAWEGLEAIGTIVGDFSFLYSERSTNDGKFFRLVINVRGSGGGTVGSDSGSSVGGMFATTCVYTVNLDLTVNLNSIIRGVSADSIKIIDTLGVAPENLPGVIIQEYNGHNPTVSVLSIDYNNSIGGMSYFPFANVRPNTTLSEGKDARQPENTDNGSWDPNDIYGSHLIGSTWIKPDTSDIWICTNNGVVAEWVKLT